MKTTTTTTSVRKADASLDVKLNPVELGSKEIVSWGEAFPRPLRRLADVGASTGTKTPHPVWRTDATIGSVLGAVGRTDTTPSSD